MSNLFKQIEGEWVQLSDKEEERVWNPTNDSTSQSLRAYLRKMLQAK